MLGYLRSLYSSLRDRARFRLFEFSHKVPSAVLSFFHKPRVGRLVFVSRSCIADALVHTPPREREELRRRSVVIYNGLSIERVRRSVDRVDSNSASVVFVSRLMEYKGGFRLVKAFVHVVEEVKDTVLHVIGEGPEGPLLRELVRKLGLEKHVIFHGWLGRRETLRVIASSRILTHPSLYESFGYVIAEAYALGKPVVAHRASYSLELVENFGAGLVVNTFDEKRYAEALMTLLTDDNLYRRLSQRALATAEEYFDIRRTAEEYLRVYREVVGE
ncbi:glycosyl transferase group 1 [Desulfurococcus mucosus DSM 2162]|uniref:Glycosyl transferase group 1 n=2 Tax=Desulfurococcus mucosus TaxID=2275 RepID=E8R8B2_DESM0|nr:glycosyl transferase group 1 [Desulfurococcus mucosus DSM 2162]